MKKMDDLGVPPFQEATNPEAFASPLLPSAFQQLHAETGVERQRRVAGAGQGCRSLGEMVEHGGFHKWGYCLEIINFNGVFPYKPSSYWWGIPSYFCTNHPAIGDPHLWNPPNGVYDIL